jgi:hypothetical protein
MEVALAEVSTLRLRSAERGMDSVAHQRTGSRVRGAPRRRALPQLPAIVECRVLPRIVMETESPKDDLRTISGRSDFLGDGASAYDVRRGVA